MRWSEPEIPLGEYPPEVKNHSTTYYNGFLFRFGGYDGRANRISLMVYSLSEQRWAKIPYCEYSNYSLSNGSKDFSMRSKDLSISSDNSYENCMNCVPFSPATGNPPSGRSGHTATLVQNEGHIDARIFIIGGWLGKGPDAAGDVYSLEISTEYNTLHWSMIETHEGVTLGPCNRHTADFVPRRQEIYVFRGGTGQEYLSDLHAFDVNDHSWRSVKTAGVAPQPRASHSSTFLNETQELFIFGGWNGSRRLNDLHILDTITSTWSCPSIGGLSPHPRAGMTLTAVNGNIFLFGGSGHASKYFSDLLMLDRRIDNMTWVDITESTSENTSKSNGYTQKSPNNSSLTGKNNTLVSGLGPKGRAGHTATAVGRKIFIHGGSCQTEYFNDLFVLDTDPTPSITISAPKCIELMERRLCLFSNDKQFSDITFIVEGNRVYGHKVILASVSDYFRKWFTESEDCSEFEVSNCSYNSFLSMMEYLYTGSLSLPDVGTQDDLECVVELLELAEIFQLYRLKEECEKRLAPAVFLDDIHDYIYEVAQKTDSIQLLAVCTHYQQHMRSNDLVHQMNFSQEMV